MAELVELTKLEQLLQSNWTKFLNPVQLLRRVLEDTRTADFRKVPTDRSLTTQSKLTITKMTVVPGDKGFLIEFWAEFAVPKDNGLAVGTYVYVLQNRETLELKESYGTILVNSDHVHAT